MEIRPALFVDFGLLITDFCIGFLVVVVVVAVVVVVVVVIGVFVLR